MCESVQVAVNVYINYSFLHLYLQFYYHSSTTYLGHVTSSVT